MHDPEGFSRRERQIMDVIYQLGSATAQDVMRSLADPPSYSAVRATLRILEGKGHLRHERTGQRYRYLPTESRGRLERSAVSKLVETFFAGRSEEALAALLDLSAPDLSEEDLDRLAAMIDAARKEGR